MADAHNVWQAKKLLERLVQEQALLISNTHAIGNLAAALEQDWPTLDGAFLARFLINDVQVNDLISSDDDLDVVITWARQLSPPSNGAVATEEEEFASRESELDAFKRPFWTPNTVEDQNAAGSRYGGWPLLQPEEDWPACGNCGRPMQFFVQVVLAELPDKLDWPHREGVVQLFYCTRSEPLCEVACAAWNADAPSVLARWLPTTDGLAPVSEPLGRERVPPPDWTPTRITGWKAAGDDFPSYGEGDADDAIWNINSDPELAEIIEGQGLKAWVGDKLGGWPAWVQGAHYPPCKACRGPMRALLQIESNGLVPFQFGDVGAGHLFQCPKHPESVAFEWSCH